MTLTEVKCMGRYRKWFWISKFYDKKRDILLSGMTLSGTHCTLFAQFEHYLHPQALLCTPAIIARDTLRTLLKKDQKEPGAWYVKSRNLLQG